MWGDGMPVPERLRTAAPAEEFEMNTEQGSGSVPPAADPARIEKSPKKEPKKRRKLTVGQAFARLLIKAAVVVAVTVLLVTVVGGVFICHTNDMYPAVRDGDLVITYRLGKCHTGDIIAYKHDGDTLFGRIVAEPGDEIYMDGDGNYTVNGTMPYETIFYETKAREMSPVTYPLTVREGEFFLLVDAREEGLDSRAIGPATETMGKVVLLIRRRGF